MKDILRLGAQVFIEPGQDKKRVAKWFEILAEHKMSTTRIRLFEDHIRQGKQWDFEIYDFALDMALKHNIKVLVTFFPSDDSVGGFKFPRDQSHLNEIAEYIKRVVLHFKDHPALDCWVLQNEPGVDERIQEGLASEKYDTWLTKRIEGDSDIPIDWSDMSWEFFFKEYTTWYLNWIADQVKLYDNENSTHVNNHQLLSNLSQYDFKNWMPFLSTLGVSIHASWHLRFFRQNQYTMAIAAHCDIIKNASLPKPFWVTELQGGNNIFSGFEPMSVYDKDIAQWIWTCVFSGAERIIFWTLNPRGKGHETGEWGMITYQDEPTERLVMTKTISEVLAKNQIYFEKSAPLSPVVTLLYSIESMITLEKVMSNSFDDKFAGRKQDAHILSVLAYYQTLSELGIPCEIKNINDFNWSENQSEQTVILANTVAISSKSIRDIYNFVDNGNRLMMTGMTGFFDEHMQNTHQTTSPFKDLTGAELKGFDFVREDESIEIDGFNVPVHMLIGELKNHHGEVISINQNKIRGVRNTYGKGHVTWIPSLIGLGSWQSDNAPLSRLLQNELSNTFDKLPFRFTKHMPGVLMKTLKDKQGYITMIANNNQYKVEVPLKMPIPKTPVLLFGESEQIGEVTIVNAGDTLIIKWV
jgi:beta-galactosidase